MLSASLNKIFPSFLHYALLLQRRRFIYEECYAFGFQLHNYVLNIDVFFSGVGFLGVCFFAGWWLFLGLKKIIQI